jgi:hypothetical protein
LLLAISIFFLVSNSGAYRGYFQDDEMDNLSWAPFAPATEFGRGLLSPFFQSHNFRPAAEFYFRVLGKFFGLDFPKYIAAIHAIHLLNVWLLWLLVRQFGTSAFSAAAACLFFAFHMASFDIYWKPAYVFDLQCGTYCLLSLLFYTQRRFVLSFVAFWLAYKSKELAVMLPAVFAAYEFWLGEGRWKTLIPFMLVSASFGLQGVFLSPHINSPYTMHFTPQAVETTTRFYSSNILLFHHAGFIAVPLGLWLGNRRVRFGIMAALLFMFPLFFLPGRLESAYCYVPLIGMAVAVSGIVQHRGTIPVVAVLTLWVGFNLCRLSRKQDTALAIAEENRSYITALSNFVQSSPETRVFIVDGLPSAFRFWGVTGTLGYLHPGIPIQTFNMGDDLTRIPADVPKAMLKWNSAERTLRASLITN